MDVSRITVNRDEALRLYRDYKKHVHYSNPVDHEIRRVYQHVAKGRMVIHGMASIFAAGLNEAGLPKLAIARADASECALRLHRDGSGSFKSNTTTITHHDNRFSTGLFRFPAGSFTSIRDVYNAKAIVPIIPVTLRPKRGLANYVILWEAEWREVVPVDPMLLRRIGKSDLFLVVASWDLTPVEQAVLTSRLRMS